MIKIESPMGPIITENNKTITEKLSAQSPPPQKKEQVASSKNVTLKLLSHFMCCLLQIICRLLPFSLLVLPVTDLLTRR